MPEQFYDENRLNRADRRKPTTEQIEAAKKARNAYYREYRRKNKDKVREIKQRYWLKRISTANSDQGQQTESED